MELNGKIWLAKSDEKVFLEPKMANRHGFIAGASGTGKTITLKVLAELLVVGMHMLVKLTQVLCGGEQSGHCLRVFADRAAGLRRRLFVGVLLFVGEPVAL